MKKFKTRFEIMLEVKKVTKRRYSVRHFEGGLNLEKITDNRAYDLQRDIEKARFCYRNRLSLEMV